MAEIVTLESPDQVANSAKRIASFTQRRLEEVLVDWLDHSAADLPVDLLPDHEVLAIAEMQMPARQQEELSELLARNREGQLSRQDHARLDELMQVYRQGFVRKAQALKVAVERGLMASLN